MSAPRRQGIIDSFGAPLPNNSNQTTNNGAGRFWGNSLGQDGFFFPTHIKAGPKAPINPWPAPDETLDILMTDFGHRRRSSTISPRTIDTLPHAQSHLYTMPHVGAIRHTSSHIFVPGPESTVFKLNDNTTGPQQPFRRTSNVSTSSSATLVSISSNTNTDSTHSTRSTTSQFPLFSLLLQICTEGLRSKWQEEVQRQQMENLTARREASGRPRGHYRHEPYRHHTQNDPAPCRAGRELDIATVKTVGSANMGADIVTEMQMMEYVRLVADTTWQNTVAATTGSAATRNSIRRATATTMAIPRAPADEGSEDSSRPAFQAQACAERAALERMQNLYSLSSSVVRAVESAAQGEIVYSVEEVGDLLGCAARLCRMLGYGEGEAAVERCAVECILREDGVS